MLHNDDEILTVVKADYLAIIMMVGKEWWLQGHPSDHLSLCLDNYLQMWALRKERLGDRVQNCSYAELYRLHLLGRALQLSYNLVDHLFAVDFRWPL